MAGALPVSNLNQWNFVLENRGYVKGPVLEIGSKRYGGTLSHDFREDFPSLRYVGVDLHAGRGVDVVCDFTNPLEVSTLGGGFRTAICLSVMEHCAHPFLMAENLTCVLVPGAVLFLCVPFIWRPHEFPNDYWRFTPAAVRVLFPGFIVVEALSYCTTKSPRKRALNDLLIGPPRPKERAASYYPIMLHMFLVRRPDR